MFSAQQITVWSLIALGLVHGTPVTEFDKKSEEMIDYINNKAQTTWTADKNTRIESMEQAKQLLGTILTNKKDRKLPVKEFDESSMQGPMPDHFDAREEWPKCKSIGQIRDQSSCGSCWAIAAVEAMTDRICIHSNGTKNVTLSTRDLLSCCEDCGDGCEGGFLDSAWEYWVEEGIVSGGLYNSSLGCQPYPFPPCAHHSKGIYPPCPHDIYPTPKCLHKCTNGSHLDYKKDKHYGKESYQIKSHEHAIMQELMTKGPIEVAFTVYEDFLLYKSGIYHHVTGDELGGHAVRMVGWGVEKGVKYWLIANSWNKGWGEDGYFRILRGKDECGIIDEAYGGIPRL